jgi:DNA-binding NtrC family response regulator
MGQAGFRLANDGIAARKIPVRIVAMAIAAEQKTILLVDDDPGILRSVSALLADDNYNVLTSTSGRDALQKSKDYKREIHLLLSDFQMPGLSGVDLASQMTRERPKLKVLLMSGFTERRLVIDSGWHFLAKPFISSQLSALVVGLVGI